MRRSSSLEPLIGHRSVGSPSAVVTRHAGMPIWAARRMIAATSSSPHATGPTAGMVWCAPGGAGAARSYQAGPVEASAADMMDLAAQAIHCKPDAALHGAKRKTQTQGDLPMRELLVEREHMTSRCSSGSAASPLDNCRATSSAPPRSEWRQTPSVGFRAEDGATPHWRCELANHLPTRCQAGRGAHRGVSAAHRPQAALRDPLAPFRPGRRY